ncbi:hypothetical protein BGZ58_005080, partial [Dissophora ornata]
MRLAEWYPFIRREGYDPALLHPSILASLATGMRRMDLLGSRYRFIRDAYSNNPLKVAHERLEKEVARYGSRDNMTIYLDGLQAEEKSDTAIKREKARTDALGACKKSLDTLESIIDNNLRVRKRHFTDVRSGLASSFYWSIESRRSFHEYMTRSGWSVKTCETEADLAIAVDTQPDDIIISGDSDMLAYASVKTLWRPVSNNLILVYRLSDVLKAPDLNRGQLTALAVVSRNDYHKNIYSFGPATNHSIIKSIQQTDPLNIISTYLSDSRVISKNTEDETFERSIRVFIKLQQNQAKDGAIPSPSQDMYHELRQRFIEVCARHDKLKKQHQGSVSKASPSGDGM